MNFLKKYKYGKIRGDDSVTLNTLLLSHMILQDHSFGLSLKYIKKKENYKNKRREKKSQTNKIKKHQKKSLVNFSMILK